MRTVHLYVAASIFSIVIYQPTHAKFWDSLKSWFGSWTKKYEQTTDRQYRCAPGGELIVKNINGTIHVETEWAENTVVVSAKKNATSEQALKAFDIVHEEKNNGKEIIIQTIQHDPALSATIEYTLLVPQNMRVTLETCNGSIIARDIKGTFTASTVRGDIAISVCNGPLTVTTQKGSITVNQAQGPVDATTSYGPITITESHDNVTAKTTSGRIRVHCKELPTNKEIWLQTKSGVITLYAPFTINADLRAKTEYGTITSNLPITIHEFTTTLDHAAWKRFKQEIKGMLGSQMDTRIRLYSRDSAIEIKQAE